MCSEKNRLDVSVVNTYEQHEFRGKTLLTRCIHLEGLGGQKEFRKVKKS